MNGLTIPRCPLSTPSRSRDISWFGWCFVWKILHRINFGRVWQGDKLWYFNDIFNKTLVAHKNIAFFPHSSTTRLVWHCGRIVTVRLKSVLLYSPPEHRYWEYPCGIKLILQVFSDLWAVKISIFKVVTDIWQHVGSKMELHRWKLTM